MSRAVRADTSLTPGAASFACECPLTVWTAQPAGSRCAREAALGPLSVQGRDSGRDRAPVVHHRRPSRLEGGRRGCAWGGSRGRRHLGRPRIDRPTAPPVSADSVVTRQRCPVRADLVPLIRADTCALPLVPQRAQQRSVRGSPRASRCREARADRRSALQLLNKQSETRDKAVKAGQENVLHNGQNW